MRKDSLRNKIIDICNTVNVNWEKADAILSLFTAYIDRKRPNALVSQLTQVEEEVGKMKEKYKSKSQWENGYITGFNRALYDVLEALATMRGKI